MRPVTHITDGLESGHANGRVNPFSQHYLNCDETALPTVHPGKLQFFRMPYDLTGVKRRPF